MLALDPIVFNSLVPIAGPQDQSNEMRVLSFTLHQHVRHLPVYQEKADSLRRKVRKDQFLVQPIEEGGQQTGGPGISPAISSQG